MILLRRRVTHTHTHLFIYKHTQQCLYLAALVYTEDRAIVEPLATSSIRQTSCYKNNIRKPRTIRVRSNITISFGFLAIESPITDCPRSLGISLPFLVRIFPKFFLSVSFLFFRTRNFGLTYFWKCQNAFELLNYFLCTHTTHIWPVSNRLAIGLSRFLLSSTNNYHRCFCCWLKRSQSSQKLYLALYKYQRSISACNDQFVPLVALIIYSREYYICTFICVYVHALIMPLFIICVGCCAHFCFSLPQTTIFS